MRFAIPALALTLTTLTAHADPVVVELYTSQGCSSCPPADEILGDLVDRDDVIALSMHVDYWDWIGWKDTFANPAFSDRQRSYAAAAGSSVVYTPQFVIGGLDQVAGPSGMKLAEYIAAHQTDQEDVLRVASTTDGRAVVARDIGEAAQLILVGVEREATVKIQRGENAGREITYHNIVRSWDVMGMWDGKAQTVALPELAEGMRYVVLAQTLTDGKPGRIVGAVAID